MYKNIVFDVDGTLINTEDSILLALQEVLLTELNKKYKAVDLEFVLGVPGTATITEFGFSDPVKALKSWEEKMKTLAHKNIIFEGVMSLVTALKSSGHTLGIVTSRRERECYGDPLFELLADHFDYIVTADSTEKHKPDGQPLLYFLDISKSRADETLYVGDTQYDSSCAQHAGVDFYLAGWGAVEPQNIKSIEELTHPFDLMKHVMR